MRFDSSCISFLVAAATAASTMDTVAAKMEGRNKNKAAGFSSNHRDDAASAGVADYLSSLEEKDHLRPHRHQRRMERANSGNNQRHLHNNVRKPCDPNQPAATVDNAADVGILQCAAGEYCLLIQRTAMAMEDADHSSNDSMLITGVCVPTHSFGDIVNDDHPHGRHLTPFVPCAEGEPGCTICDAAFECSYQPGMPQTILNGPNIVCEVEDSCSDGLLRLYDAGDVIACLDYGSCNSFNGGPTYVDLSNQATLRCEDYLACGDFTVIYTYGPGGGTLICNADYSCGNYLDVYQYDESKLVVICNGEYSCNRIDLGVGSANNLCFFCVENDSCTDLQLNVFDPDYFESPLFSPDLSVPQAIGSCTEDDLDILCNELHPDIAKDLEFVYGSGVVGPGFACRGGGKKGGGVGGKKGDDDSDDGEGGGGKKGNGDGDGNGNSEPNVNVQTSDVYPNANRIKDGSNRGQRGGNRNKGPLDTEFSP